MVFRARSRHQPFPADGGAKVIELDDPDRELVAAVMDALRELKRAGTPIKDYLDEDDIEDALRIVARLGKAIGLKPKQRTR